MLFFFAQRYCFSALRWLASDSRLRIASVAFVGAMKCQSFHGAFGVNLNSTGLLMSLLQAL